MLLAGAYIYPNMTFAELDSLKIKPDVIVIPAMVGVFKDPKSSVIRWIKEKTTPETKVLSICAGSLVAAASGLYDGKPLTTHASMFEESKEAFPKPLWVQNLSVTKSDNLYSTAGVSNAVEGSLTIIRELFGQRTQERVMSDIHYPYADIKTEHQSVAITTGHKFTIAHKIFLKKNRKAGILLQDGVNELSLAAVLDTYHRTFPSALETFMNHGTSITSKYGLTIVPTGSLSSFEPDEVHILLPDNLSKSDEDSFKKASVVKYTHADNRYIINQCLERVKSQYGPKFENITKLLLDYNLKEVCPYTQK
ncbi:DJ-1/PfpI family protein [Flavobacterium sp. XGLA_31]|uniref:DJ-1/PfpI family protein n=1 Tax=Flavobacterium sp. XGLA_31 TaxID=3447666 RepID=UPI003F376DB7